MGYRKAARMRRTQYVGGHYRTSKKGKTYWVNGHMRNDYGEDSGCGILFFLMVLGPFTFGITWVVMLIYCWMDFSDKKALEPKHNPNLPPGAKPITSRMYERDGKYYLHDNLG